MAFYRYSHLGVEIMTTESLVISFDDFLDILFVISLVGAVASSIAVHRMNKKRSHK